MTQSISINLKPNEYIQELHYYLFVVDLYRYVGICSAVKDWSNRVWAPNKTKDLNIGVIMYPKH